MATDAAAGAIQWAPTLQHELPGRLRVRIPAVRGDAAAARRAVGAALLCAGVRQADANPATGSLLVEHDGVRGGTELIAELGRVLNGDRRGGTDGIVGPHGTATARGRKARASRAAPGPTKAAKPKAAPASKTAAGAEGIRAVPNAEVTPDPGNKDDWHGLSSRACLNRLRSDPARGLGASDAAERLSRYGPNALPETPPPTLLDMLTDQIATAPVGLLAGSAAVSIATGAIVDAAAIGVVVAINSIIGVGTERQSERIIRSLAVGAPDTARVIRDGEAVDVPLAEVVPGDLILLAPGTYVAADARLIRVNHLSVDESALTGESLPVDKAVDPELPANAPLAERVNMLYRGTVVAGGNGTALVVATGLETELGKIQTAAGRLETPETPMQRQLDDLGTRLAILSAAACGVVFGIGLLRRLPLIELLRTSVSLGVAAVPEGLPAVATTTLALGIRRMRRHQASVRRLGAVEALGAIEVLCLDKTGTLTRNRMAVTALAVDGHRLEFAADGTPAPGPLSQRRFDQFLRALALCNESIVTRDELGRPQTQGSATENALLELAVAGNLDIDKTRERYPLLATHHRAEGRPFMITEHRLPGGRRLLVMKGSPRAVVERCARLRRGRGTRNLSETDAAEVVRENERWAGDGLRVLAVATATLDKGAKAAEAPFEYLGLVGLSDPLRDGVKELIADLHAAGIRTVMITGDQSATAYAIATELGLSGNRPLKILDSTDLGDLDADALTGLAQEVDVFARVSPSHKLEIVQALRRTGQVVAMTGDGINDGPALKAADVGVAMGSAQLDVARSVADIVIEDDNLATLVTAIAEGRTTYGNIRKTVRFLLSTNFGEIGIVLASLLLGLKPPFNAMQLLWINLVTDIFPGLALAQEPAEDGVLSRPPRDPAEPIIGNEDLATMIRESAVMTGGTLASYLYGLWRYGPGPQASTLALSTIVGGELAHALACRCLLYTSPSPRDS